MATYLATIERAASGANWSAAVPDLHVYATGDTREDAIRAVRAAAQWHVDGLVEDGLPIPAPSGETAPAAVPVRV